MIRLSPLILVAVLSASGAAIAQDGQVDYDRGVEALEAGATDRALVHFRAALEAEPHPDHALALAATLQQDGELTDAIELYGRLLDGEFGPVGDAMAAAARRASSQADRERASLGVTGPRAIVIEVDGEPRGRLQGEPLTLRLDPGGYRIRGTTGAGSTEVFVLTLAAGEERSISLPAVELPAEDAQPEPEALIEEPQPTTTRARGPWILIGLSIAPLAAGITTAVLFRRRIDQADAAPSLLEAEPAIRDAERFGPIATASFALAGALALTGLVWALVDRRRAADDGSLSLRISPTSLSLGGTF